MVCFQVKAVINNTAMNTLCMTFGTHMYMFLLGIFLAVELCRGVYIQL